MAPAGSARRTFLAALLALCLPAVAGAQDTPKVAAASDLKFALDEVLARFRADTGRAAQVAYGSSGNFFRQIAEGAPFELFLSADESYVQRLAERGLTIDQGMVYAAGRLALFAPAGSPLKPAEGLAGLARALAAGQLRRFAIANPEHAPYGRAAREALQAAGLWEQLAPRLVLGENVSQAAQFAASGSAQGGIIAYSLAISPELARLGSHALLPADGHQPLIQRMVLTRGAGDTARRLYRYLSEPPARAILRRYGFRLPGED